MANSYHPFEKDISNTLGSLLGIQKIDPSTDFFILGADELILFRLLNKLHLRYPNAPLSWRDITEHSTVNALANCMIKRSATSDPAFGCESKLTIKEQFLQASPPNRVQVLDGYLRDRISHALDESSAVVGTQSESNFHQHTVYKELIWAFKRDFQCPIYQTEIEQSATISQLAVYFTKELEIRWGLQPHQIKASKTEEVPFAQVEEKSERIDPPLQKQVQNVVLLLSAPRSGSTLLRLMLGGHSQLFCPPELNLLHHDDLSSWLQNRLKRFPRDTYVVHNLMYLMGFGFGECEEIINDPAQHAMPISEVYQRILAQSGKATLIDKTPSYAKHLKTLQRAESVFEKPRYIHLIRHPYAVIESFVRHRFEKLIGKRGDDPYRCAEETWLRRNRNILTMARCVDQSRYHQIRYEDLVQEPEKVMQELSVFLHVPFEMKTVKPYADPALISGPGDYDIFQHDRIEPQLADGWQHRAPPSILQAETIELAEQFGYEVKAG